jgi:non-specific serine/threonine protein kinase
MASLIGQLISHYTIIEKLGEGGMGIIYRAEDQKLKRTVALKVLRDSYADDEVSKRRFLSEAQNASSLQHSNICTIHEIDETPDGQLFIVLEHYEGETLKKRIARGSMSVPDITGIVHQIAQGLQEAHKKGIIHRDIKPANIFLTREGTVKILDFGLAKRIDRTQFTRVGEKFGTTDYMSPEQIKGQRVDRRTDIWSLGVLLYEMLTGQPPFRAEYEQAIVYLILNQDPEDVRQVRGDVPEHLLKVLERSMAKEPDDRYADLASLLEDLQRTASGSEIGESEWVLPAPRPSQSIAVLPFINVNGNPEEEAFCDGLTLELINALSRIRDLRVVASTSAFVFKGAGVDVRSAGRKLNVKTVLEGSVRRASDKLRVTAQLVNVTDGCQLWSDRYDCRVQDVFGLQEDIAPAIVEALKVRLLEAEEEKLFKRLTDNLDAYNLFQQGYYAFNQLDLVLIAKAMEYFRKAIERDPGFATAYAALAGCHFMMTYFGVKRNCEVRPLMKQCIEKALEIDMRNSAAYHVLGLLRSCLESKHGEAERAYRRSLELDPNEPMALRNYSINRVSAGQFELARKLAERAKEIDPLSDYIELCTAFPDFYADRYDRVLEKIAKFGDATPPFLWGLWFLWRTLSLTNRKVEAAEVCKRVFVVTGAKNVVQIMETVGSDHAIGAAASAMAEVYKQRYVSPYDIAIFFSHAGRQEEAISWVGIAVEDMDPKLHFLNVDPEWRSVRSDLRFANYLKAAGWGHD